MRTRKPIAVTAGARTGHQIIPGYGTGARHHGDADTQQNASSIECVMNPWSCARQGRCMTRQSSACRIARVCAIRARRKARPSDRMRDRFASARNSPTSCCIPAGQLIGIVTPTPRSMRGRQIPDRARNADLMCAAAVLHGKAKGGVCRDVFSPTAAAEMLKNHGDAFRWSRNRPAADQQFAPVRWSGGDHSAGMWSCNSHSGRDADDLLV